MHNDHMVSMHACSHMIGFYSFTAAMSHKIAIILQLQT